MSEDDSDDEEPEIVAFDQEEYDLKIILQPVLTVVHQTKAFLKNNREKMPHFFDEFKFFKETLTPKLQRPDGMVLKSFIQGEMP